MGTRITIFPAKADHLFTTDKTEVMKIDLDHIRMGDSVYLLEQNEKVVLDKINWPGKAMRRFLNSRMSA